MHLLQPGVRVHLVGIGGIGLSAIARVLHGRGFSVSGSDQQITDLTRALIREGIVVHSGHRAAWVAGAGLVIVSSAVPPDNPELEEAHRLGLTVVKREQILGELTDGKTTIAVAGTHGKTTTAAMIAWILSDAGLDPTFVVGGILQNLGTNARAGTGPHFVIEADEYDRAFLGLKPHVAIITTLDHDHPDCYPSMYDMRVAFSQFADQVVDGGLLVVCGEDPECRALAARAAEGHRRVEVYGFERHWNWWVEGSRLGNSASFEVRHHGQTSTRSEAQDGKWLGACTLQVPGRHNVLNALAALASCAEAGIDFDTASTALTRFRGTGRRFEVKGQSWGVTVVDDYAHHPTEIRATLSAARSKYPGRPIWAVFQPHTYSRTAALLHDFGAALAAADHVIVTPIYAARERDTLGMSGQTVVASIPREHPDARFGESLQQAVETLLAEVRPGDLVVTMGAGDGYLIGERVLEQLAHREDRP